MRRALRIAALCWLAGAFAGAQQNRWAGTYEGDWSSTVLAVRGSFRLSLSPKPGGDWNCEVMFTMGERKVETTIKSLKVGDATIDVSYEFDLGDSRLMSTIHGQLDGGKLEGKYSTKSVPDGTPADEGVWKAAARR